jgi:hypothetical protein
MLSRNKKNDLSRQSNFDRLYEFNKSHLSTYAISQIKNKKRKLLPSELELKSMHLNKLTLKTKV